MQSTEVRPRRRSMVVHAEAHPVIRVSPSSVVSADRPSSRREAFRRAMRASRSSASSSWSSHVLSISGRDMTARWALEIFSLMSVAAVDTCWISRGPSAAADCEDASVGGASIMRLRSLWRSGRISKVVGGGRPGEAEAGACSAGVAEPVGGSEARADAGAWGVAAPDMIRVAKARGVVIVEIAGLGVDAGDAPCPTRRAARAAGDWLCMTVVPGGC